MAKKRATKKRARAKRVRQVVPAVMPEVQHDAAVPTMPPMDAADVPEDAAEPTRKMIDVSITVPVWLAEPDRNKTYVTPHVDCDLTGEQSETLWRIRQALQTTGVRLKNGRHVQSSADVVRYLCELLSVSRT